MIVYSINYRFKSDLIYNFYTSSSLLNCEATRYLRRVLDKTEQKQCRCSSVFLMPTFLHFLHRSSFLMPNRLASAAMNDLTARRIVLLAIFSTISFREMSLWPGTQYISICSTSLKISRKDVHVLSEKTYLDFTLLMCE